MMPSGQSRQVFTRSSELGWDLKEKITLKHNIDINQIQLLFNTKKVLDNVSVSGLKLYQFFVIILADYGKAEHHQRLLHQPGP